MDLDASSKVRRKLQEPTAAAVSGITQTSPGVFSSTFWGLLGFRPTSFGEDEHGELYITTRDGGDGGTVYRLVSPSSIFSDGFESGDVSAW